MVESDIEILTLMYGYLFQHYKELNFLKFEDLFVNGRENEHHDLLTLAATGNYAFLQELLKAGMDPNIGDSEGRTPLVGFHLLWILILREREGSITHGNLEQFNKGTPF